MGDLVLSHSAKGTSWIKRNHLWVKKYKKNGKTVYVYKTEETHKKNVSNASDTRKKLLNDLEGYNTKRNFYNEAKQGGISIQKAGKLFGNGVKSDYYKVKSKTAENNKKQIQKQLQKSYSDYESQKRMAASAAGAATRSSKYKNYQKKRTRREKLKVAIKNGKAKVRDIITKLTNPAKYEAQQQYKKKQAAQAAAKKRKKTKSHWDAQRRLNMWKR